MDAKLAQAIRIKAQALHCQVDDLIEEYCGAVMKSGGPQCLPTFDPQAQLEEAMNMLEAASRNLEADAEGGK